MTEQTEINCSICRGIRPCRDGRCLGCGSNIRICGSVKEKSAVHCPQCGRSKSVSKPEADRFHCSWCNIVFEKDDFVCLDDRPEVSAMKKERLELEKKRGGRHHRGRSK